MEKPAVAISDHFADLEDPRIDRTKLHQLLDIIIVAICAVICGADSWVEVEEFGNAKIDWFRTFLELPNGIPSHDTFGRVFALTLTSFAVLPVGSRLSAGLLMVKSWH